MKDNFSTQASIYAKFRPRYPQKLFDFILSHVNTKDCAWDCATGNGQTAIVLSKYFNTVYATDISKQQLDAADKAGNINYSLQPAESTNLASNSCDLITVSQALHWFDFPRFYSETKRVAKPGAILAAWGYNLLYIDPRIDEIVQVELYENMLGDKYWDKERKLVDESYSTIPFPFEKIPVPIFHIESEWTLDQLTGYLNSWSAVQRYIRQNNNNPVDAILPELKKRWTAPSMKVRFPLFTLMTRL